MKMDCIVIENNILELINEIEQQLSSGVTCCKCKNPCNKSEDSISRCSMSMKNLLTDISIFKKMYIEHNPVLEVEEVKELEDKVQLDCKQV